MLDEFNYRKVYFDLMASDADNLPPEEDEFDIPAPPSEKLTFVERWS